MIESYTSNNRLGVAVQLKYIQIVGSFPRRFSDIPPLASEYLSQQLNLPLFTLERYEWDGRSVKRHRQHIRNFLSYRIPTSEDAEAILNWLKLKVLPFDHNPQHIQESVIDWCRHNRVESPTEGRLERIINSAASGMKMNYSVYSWKTFRRTINQIDLFFETDTDFNHYEKSVSTSIDLNTLKSDPGRIGLDSVLKETAKLSALNFIELPESILSIIPNKIADKYKLRVATGTPVSYSS